MTLVKMMMYDLLLFIHNIIRTKENPDHLIWVFLRCAGGETPFDLTQDKLLVSPK